jgi:hypothetical protein
VSKGKRKQRRRAPEPTGLPIVACVGEGCSEWGLHLLETPQGDRLPVCFTHLQLGHQDAMKAEIRALIAEQAYGLALRIREHRGLGEPSLLVRLEYELGISRMLG